MTLQKQKSEQPLKSILKQPRLVEDPQIRILEREVKYWKTRFCDLMSKRQKQIQSTYRESIWDKQQDEEKEIELFKQLEQQITSDNQDQQQSSGVKHLESTRESSLENLGDDSINNLQVRSSPEIFKKNEGSCSLKKLTSLQETNTNWVELNQEIQNLTLDRDQWKQKYEESVHPRSLQKIHESILQDFIQKAQSGIQEAAEQFEEEKRAYISQKDSEIKKLQQKIFEYASMVSEKDSLLLQKELSIAEIELCFREKDTLLSKAQDEIKSHSELVTSLQQEIESYSKSKLQWLEVEQKLREEMNKTISEKLDIEKINQNQQQVISDLQQKLTSARQQCDEQKEKITKLKNEKEDQDELDEQMEEYRSKTCSLEKENEMLKTENNNLQIKLKNYEKMIQQKSVEVQQMIFNLQEEMKNYATEVGLLQQAEIKQNGRIKELEALLLREKQLTLILQDSILNKSLALQQQRLHKKQNENDKSMFQSNFNDRKLNEKTLFKDTINLQQYNSNHKQEEVLKEIQSAQYLVTNNEND